MEPAGTLARTIAQRYVVIERVPTRGASRLYTATQADSGRNVVVREFEPTGLTTDEVLARISRIAAVSSRFLATLIDAAAMDATRIYVAHEHLSGESLAARLVRKGRFAPSEAAALCVRMLKGLDALHGREQVHGALRPTRVFHELRPRHGWHVKLLSAGIESVDRELARADATLARYAPPEWLDGGPWTQQGDVFCAGLILFECLVGRPAFEASTLTSPTPDLAELASIASPALVELVHATLERAPDARPAAAGTVLDRLLAVHPEAPPQAKPVTQRSEWTRGKFVGKEVPVGYGLTPSDTQLRGTGARRRGDVNRARWTAVAVTALLAMLLVGFVVVQAQRRERGLVARLAAERTRASAEAQRVTERARLEQAARVEPAPVVPAMTADAAVRIARPSTATAVHSAADGRPRAGFDRGNPVGQATDMGLLEVHVATPCNLMLDGVAHGESSVMVLLARDGTHELTCARLHANSHHLLVHVRVGQRTSVRFNEVGQADISMEPLPPS